MSYISEDNSEFDFFIGQSRPKSMFGTEQSYKVAHQYGAPAEHFLNFDNPYEQSLIQDNERMPEQTIKEMQKMKNRQKAKRFRDKKKVITNLAFTKIKQLESENNLLKQTTVVCGRCKTKVYKETSMTEIHQKHQNHELEFEPPKLGVEKPETGKIWIALGIIMLIIGINIHGFNKQPIEINLPPSFVNKIQKQLQSGSESIRIPFSVKEKSDVFREPTHPDRKTGAVKQSYLLIQQDDEEFRSGEIVEVKKDFIMRLHAEINQIGNYL